MQILTFKVTYVLNGCKKQGFLNSDLDLDMFNFEEMEGYILRNQFFKFDQILNWHYVDIVGIVEGKKEKKKPTLKYGRKKSDEALEPRPAPIKKASD